MDDEVGRNIAPSQFEAAFGEPLAKVLDFSTWVDRDRLPELYAQLTATVTDSVEREKQFISVIREGVLPKLKTRTAAPPQAGLYFATPEQIQRTHDCLLFNGQVEACDANVHGHDSLVLTIHQIGVSLVRYNGADNSWVHRLFRRDMRGLFDNQFEELMNLLEIRERRPGIGIESSRDHLSELVRRGIMDYMERAALLEQSTALWRMGHGDPTPFSLLTGSGYPELLTLSLNMLSKLIEEHKRFVYVASAPNRALLTLGQALQPLEYLVVENMRDQMYDIVSKNRTMGRVQDQALEFVERAGSQILRGLYRASASAPPYVFYAHRDHIHEAALVAIADSTLQLHRGFPTLIDLADATCRNALGADGFTPGIETAYAEANAPFLYQVERASRRL